MIISCMILSADIHFQVLYKSTRRVYVPSSNLKLAKWSLHYIRMHAWAHMANIAQYYYCSSNLFIKYLRRSRLRHWDTTSFDGISWNYHYHRHTPVQQLAAPVEGGLYNSNPIQMMMCFQLLLKIR